VAEFAETNALVAALEDNEEWGMEILNDFYGGELDTLMDACLRLFKWCQEAQKTVVTREQARDLVALRDELRR
jgi:hypothetical protein